MNQIGFRIAREGDERFIRHSWVESFRVSHYAGMIPMEDYHRNQHRWCQKLMDRDGVSVVVAYEIAHEPQIYGFCVVEDGFTLPVLHYVYVKDDYRQLPQKDPAYPRGIATMLLERAGINPKAPFYYTYKTGIWASLVKQNSPFGGGIYRPLFARFPRDAAIRHEAELTAQRERRRSKPLQVEFKHENRDSTLQHSD